MNNKKQSEQQKAVRRFFVGSFFIALVCAFIINFFLLVISFFLLSLSRLYQGELHPLSFIRLR